MYLYYFMGCVVFVKGPANEWFSTKGGTHILHVNVCLSSCPLGGVGLEVDPWSDLIGAALSPSLDSPQFTE